MHWDCTNILGGVRLRKFGKKFGKICNLLFIGFRIEGVEIAIDWIVESLQEI